MLPSFVGAYALVLHVRPRRHRHRQWLRDLGIPFESIYGAKGIVAVYALTLYPYVVLPTLAGLQGDRRLGRGGGAEPRRVALARMLRTVTLPLVLPSILAGALLVFIEALENFGVPFVLAEDKPILAVEAYKLFVGETDRQSGLRRRARRAAGRSARSLALLIQRRYLGAAPLCDRRAPLAAAACRSAAALRLARRRLLLDRGRSPRWCRSSPSS